MENKVLHGGKTPQKHWFAVKVVSGTEASIMEQIKKNYMAAGLEDLFEEVYCPSTTVSSTTQNNKTVTKTKFLYPGYIFIKMAMQDTAKDAVLSVPKVYHFLSDSSGKPSKISEKEFAKMFESVEEQHKANANGKSFAIGDKVKITSGSFNEFQGTVLSVDAEQKVLAVSVMVFQRETRVEVNFGNAQKIEQNKENN